MITEYKNLCAFCGGLACTTHHLIFGRGIRPLADDDGITVPICNVCHAKIHAEGFTGTMSKIIGQLAWEKEAIEEGNPPDLVREQFRERYGRSWL